MKIYESLEIFFDTDLPMLSKKQLPNFPSPKSTHYNLQEASCCLWKLFSQFENHTGTCINFAHSVRLKAFRSIWCECRRYHPVIFLNCFEALGFVYEIHTLKGEPGVRTSTISWWSLLIHLYWWSLLIHLYCSVNVPFQICTFSSTFWIDSTSSCSLA